MALITTAEVVTRAMTNANFDLHLIKDTFIEISEWNHLRPFLGKDLYNACVAGSGLGLPASYATLNATYVKDYLAFCVKFEILTYKKAETFKKKMHIYLDDNSTLYPEWGGCGGCNSCRSNGSVSKRHGIITY